MSLENPTRLRIGMHGHFSGKDYRLVGRVVMGVTEDGETYYWNEFNLKSKGGETATLVYEVTERGGEWRLFTMFEPEYPMTAADAATKRVGDRLNLTGEDVRVTLRDTSCVYRIEGEAPVGLKVGDVADYFNAEAGPVMQVVSWTGDEVEFYHGINLSRGLINSAFNLPLEPGALSGTGRVISSFRLAGSENNSSGIIYVLMAAFGIILGLLIFGQNLSCSAGRAADPVIRLTAGPGLLFVGGDGRLNHKHYRITAHAIDEIDEVGLHYERHEYQVTDDFGNNNLLVCGLKPGDKKWTLFTAFVPSQPPRAEDCGAKKVGDLANFDDVSAKVTEIFLSTIIEVDGSGLAERQPGEVRFGYLAQSNYNPFLARWNNSSVEIMEGVNVDPDMMVKPYPDLPIK
jgi:hypothetical protein